MNPYEELLKNLTYGTEMYVNPPRHCGKSAAMNLVFHETTCEEETTMTLDHAMHLVAEHAGLDIMCYEDERYPSTEYYRYISRTRGFTITIKVPKYARGVAVRKNRWIRAVYEFMQHHMKVDGRFYNIFDIIVASNLELEMKEIDEERIKDSVARYRARAPFKLMIDDLPFAPLDIDKLNAAITTLEERDNDMKLAIKNVIFNNPATIVFWLDGTKTVVKAENEEFDPEKGLAMAICKKTLGNKGSYYNEIKKWIK